MSGAVELFRELFSYDDACVERSDCEVLYRIRVVCECLEKVNCLCSAGWGKAYDSCSSIMSIIRAWNLSVLVEYWQNREH